MNNLFISTALHLKYLLEKGIKIHFYCSFCLANETKRNEPRIFLAFRFGEYVRVEAQSLVNCALMSFCFLARHLASLKCQTHSDTHTYIRHFEQCTHTHSDTHIHLLYYECLAHTHTWYLNCTHYSNCCLQFANIFMLRRDAATDMRK